MRTKLSVALAVVSLLLTGQVAQTAEKSAAATELGSLMAKVQAKLKEGKRTETDLTDELKQFDALLAKHEKEQTDDVAQILYMKAMLYTQVLKNQEKGDQLRSQLKKDFPESKQAASIKKEEESEKIRSALVEGTKFPEFDEKDVNGKPLSLANYKGKVVLIDFWAVWCGPCVKELPNVLKTYEKHHDAGFEIIGISLDKDQDKLATFTREKKMPWQQFFDGQGWSNKLSTRYGVNSIPATYLLDGEGKIIGKNLRGEELEKAVAKALGKS